MRDPAARRFRPGPHVPGRGALDLAGQRSADRRQELIDAGWFAVRASELLEPGGARCEPGVGEVVHPATQRLGLGESSMGLGERCQLLLAPLASLGDRLLDRLGPFRTGRFDGGERSGK